MKLTELIQNKGEFSYSFEVTPDVSGEDLDNLLVNPLFFSVTWHAKSHECRDFNIEPIRIASLLRKEQKHVLLHLTCDFMRVDYLDKLLIILQKRNIRNLFLVLGEGYEPTTSDFKNTTEMMTFIRHKTGRYFCIGIAGFADCSDERLVLLKEKIDTGGADFILTQAFFDANKFKSFMERCQTMEIDVPIIPGIFPFASSKQLNGFIDMCRIKVSHDLLEAVKVVEHMNRPCIEIVKMLIQDLQVKCNATHFHFFTLNNFDNVQNLIEQMK